MINIIFFKVYTSLCLIGHKTAMRKCDKNIANKNYANIRNYLSKKKELDQIVLQTGLFTSVTGHLNPEGQAEVESPLIRSYF